jgi:hypothetical protein
MRRRIPDAERQAAALEHLVSVWMPTWRCAAARLACAAGQKYQENTHSFVRD